MEGAAADATTLGVRFMPPPLLLRRAAFTFLCLVLLASQRALGAAEEPSIEVLPPAARPGDVLLVLLRGVTAPAKGKAGERPLHFYTEGDHQEAVSAVPLEAEAGPLAVHVEAGPSELTAAVQLLPGEFPQRELTVAAKFIAPPDSVKARIAADAHAFSKAWRTPFGPRGFSEGFARPRDSEVTAHFGDQRLLNGKKKTVHYGLDLDGQTGDPVQASNDGTVVLVRDCYTTGNTILISHGGGVFTGYFHLSAFKVKRGAKVKRGQLIGLVGKTGRVTGPHLHFLAHVDALSVNPEALLALPFP
jgi:murein DD-endopeptidase MepM/ murein hydrolase activator NlpD